MNHIILILHVGVALGMIILILLQSSQGGLVRSFSSQELYRSKRGAEKIVFIATIVTAVLFFLTSVLSILVR